MGNSKINGVFRFSIPVKVLVSAGLAYVAALLAVSWLASHFEWFAHPFVFLIPQCVAAAAATAASHFFLDRPLVKLTGAMIRAGEGDFLIRVPTKRVDEIGILSWNFNRMLERLTDLSAHKIQADHDLILAQEELKFKKRLEEKNRQIEKANSELADLVQDLSLLYEIGQGINQTIDLDHLYQITADVLKRHLKLETFSFMVWNSAAQKLETRSAFGFEKKQAVLQMTFRKGEGVAGMVVQSGREIYVPDTEAEPRFMERGVPLCGSLLAVPLAYKGETLGVINFGRGKAFAFGPNDIRMLVLVASQVALAMANARLYTQTRELSVTDELTGVFNRRHFNQVLQMEWKRAVRFKRELSLLMVDIDYFKRYNDTHGHLKGDEALKNLGDLLLKNLREVDTVARFGGEEFIVLLPDTDKRGAIAVAEKLRYLVQEKGNGITISVGVASFPEDVQEMEDLIDHADIALYEAKDKGRNRVLTYTGTPQPQVPPSSPEETPKPTKPRLVH